MKRAQVYRHIGRPQLFLGIEPADFILLASFAWLLMVFLPDRLFIFSFALVGLAYGGIRLGKRGKPAGYTLALLRYSLRRSRFLSAAAVDSDGRQHPFQPGATGATNNSRRNS